jgi:RHS repeat-associated protein
MEAALHAGSLLAAGLLQPPNENSRLGHPLSTVSLYPGIGFVNSNTATGLRVCLYDDGRRSRATGKERDSESGLDYFGARYYGSALGRFTSPDWSPRSEPVPYADFENPQSLNQYSYSYVGNNPLSRSDPDGHCEVDGETHGALWCFAHAIKLVETQHEQANDARSFFANNNVMINGQHVDPSQLNDQQANAAFKQFNDDYRASGGALNPGGALAGMLAGAGLKYEPNSGKHGSTARGDISAEPTNPHRR